MTQGKETAFMGRRGLAVGPAFCDAGSSDRRAPRPAAESTFDRVPPPGFRIAALPGELPTSKKNLVSGEWSGACISMAQDLAKVFDAKLEYIESNLRHSVLDLHPTGGPGVLADPTPLARCRSVSPGRYHPPVRLPGKEGLAPKIWDDLNKPELTIVFDLGACTRPRHGGTAPESAACRLQDSRRVYSGAASAERTRISRRALLGLATVGKNPALGPYYLLTNPTVALPSCLVCSGSGYAVPRSHHAWLDMNRGTADPRVDAGGPGRRTSHTRPGTGQGCRSKRKGGPDMHYQVGLSYFPAAVRAAVLARRAGPRWA